HLHNTIPNSFPTRRSSDLIVQFIAKQMEIEPSLYSQYNWNGRTIKYHRAQIRDFFGFREATVQDATSIGNWLEQHAMNVASCTVDRKSTRLNSSHVSNSYA